jgi:hypothetical protein
MDTVIQLQVFLDQLSNYQFLNEDAALKSNSIVLVTDLSRLTTPNSGDPRDVT